MDYFFDLPLTILAIVSFIIVGILLSFFILFTKAKLVRSTPCKIKINNDEKLTEEVAAGGTLLTALLANGIPVPSPCGGKATCKQCKVQILEGAGPLLEPDKATFNKKQLQEGWRLSCQCKIKTDLSLKIPEDLLSVEQFEGTVLSNQNVATFIKELVIELPKEIEYKSGSYLLFHTPVYKTNTSDWKSTIDPKFYEDWEKFQLFQQEIDYSSLPDEIIRAYSMASYPKEGKILKFNVRIASPPIEKGKVSKKPWGICSSYLFSLKKGDKVTLSGPYGESFMIQDERPVIFLIGGAGSSFARSHILHLFETENTKRKITLWYGARSLKENIYEEEYKNLDQKRENFDYHLVLSEPLKEDFEKGWPSTEADPIRTNYLFKAFELGQLQKMQEPEEALYYVCGPPMHNQCVMKLLDDYGVPRESIILDDFGN